MKSQRPQDVAVRGVPLGLEGPVLPVQLRLVGEHAREQRQIERCRTREDWRLAQRRGCRRSNRRRLTRGRELHQPFVGASSETRVPDCAVVDVESE
jgi:hypothetical protein